MSPIWVHPRWTSPVTSLFLHLCTSLILSGIRGRSPTSLRSHSAHTFDNCKFLTLFFHSSVWPSGRFFLKRFRWRYGTNDCFPYLKSCFSVRSEFHNAICVCYPLQFDCLCTSPPIHSSCNIRPVLINEKANLIDVSHLFEGFSQFN